MSSDPISSQEILLATDFCEPARRALTCAKQIARHRSAPLRAVHVLDLTESALTGSAAARGSSFAASRDSAEHDLRAIRRELRLAGLSGTATLISAGKPAAALRQAVHEYQPALLILGINGTRSRSAASLGATARALLNHPPCPLLTVGENGPEPAGADDAMKRAIVVLDGSAECLRAAVAAWPFAAGEDCPALFTVLPPRRRTPFELPADLRRRFQPIRAVDRENAALTIMHHAEETQAGVIVAAFHSGGRLDDWTRGSLLHTLVTQSPCPVLTVRT